MSRWFRHYSGMVRDEKLIDVAVQCDQPFERVIFVWSWILEAACDANSGGAFSANPKSIAYMMRCDAEAVVSIINGLMDAGRIVDGVVAQWSERQFESDTSKDRVAAYRERKKGVKRPRNVTPPLQAVTVTAPDAETETDTEKKQQQVAREREVSDFKSECLRLVGTEPCLTAFDFGHIEAMVAHGTPPEDVLAGIAVGMAKRQPGFRFLKWKNFDGWIRNVPTDRLAGARVTVLSPRGPPKNPIDDIRDPMIRAFARKYEASS